MNYLKPNFSNHPMNYLSLIIVFFASFYSASSFALDGDYSETGFYFVNNSNQHPSRTPAQVCTNWGAATALTMRYKTPYGSSQQNYVGGCEYENAGNWYGLGGVTKQTCGQSIAEYCQPIVPECAEGTKKEITREITPPKNMSDVKNHNGELVIEITSGSDSSGNEYMWQGGCQYVRSQSDPQQTSTYRPLEYELAGIYQTAEWIATGEASATVPDTTNSWASDDPELPEITDDLIDQKSDQETTILPEEVIQVGDDTVKTQTTIITETVGEGTKVTKTATTTTSDFSEGIEKKVTTTTTVTEHLDGSTVEVVNTETTYTQKDNIKYIFNEKTGEITIVDGPNHQTKKTTSTTTTKNSLGDVTGVSTTTGNSSTGNGTADGSCSEADSSECLGLDFSEIIEESVDQAPALTAIENSIASALDGYQTTVTEGIESAVSDSNIPSFLSLSNIIENVVPNSSACIPLTYSAGGHSFVISCDFSNYFKQIFGWILYILTLYSIFYVAVFGLPNSPQGAK